MKSGLDAKPLFLQVDMLRFKENNENDMAAQVFWAVFIPTAGRALSAQQQISMVLPFHPLYFPWSEPILVKL